ncbi:hypothetical protein HPB50_013705 [Hyalomma asiaticum]|uniref:Uncharacterized protein n=1 Tax=Hyalomma asiaticum TaxID=266040 RepID=A0ACB7T6S7_HYAAI|nr:hypothetical protein HPB50_013705 [Hyalomma asiaticum]
MWDGVGEGLHDAHQDYPVPWTLPKPNTAGHMKEADSCSLRHGSEVSKFDDVHLGIPRRRDGLEKRKALKRRGTGGRRRRNVKRKLEG